MIPFITEISQKYQILVLEDEHLTKEEHSGECTPCYIYVWGMQNTVYSQLQFPIIRGFTNVKDGFFNIKKGIAVNLNALLVKNGISSVNLSYDFSLKNEFLAIEREAKKERIGMWK